MIGFEEIQKLRDGENIQKVILVGDHEGAFEVRLRIQLITAIRWSPQYKKEQRDAATKRYKKDAQATTLEGAKKWQRWKGEPLEELKVRLANGETKKEIALAMGRTYKSIDIAIRKFKLSGLRPGVIRPRAGYYVRSPGNE
jgi:hypothetical protein